MVIATDDGADSFWLLLDGDDKVYHLRNTGRFENLAWFYSTPVSFFSLGMWVIFLRFLLGLIADAIQFNYLCLHFFSISIWTTNMLQFLLRIRITCLLRLKSTC